MTKPVTGQTTFGSNTTGTTTQLDNNFLLAYNALNDLNTYPNFLTDTGSANTVVVTLAANLTGALTNGLVIQIKVAATNTGASTLNYNSGGALNILNLDGTSLSAGQLVSGGIYQFGYRSSDTSWLLMTPAGSAGIGQSLVLLSALTANANTAMNFNVSSTYDVYKLVGSNITIETNNANLLLRMSNNGVNYNANASAYAFSTYGSTDGGAVGSSGNTTASGIPLTVSTNNTRVLSFEVTLYAPSSSNANKLVSYQGIYGQSGFIISPITGGGMYYGNQNAVSAIQVLASSGNISSGNIALYGVRRA